MAQYHDHFNYESAWSAANSRSLTPSGWQFMWHDPGDGVRKPFYIDEKETSGYFQHWLYVRNTHLGGTHNANCAMRLASAGTLGAVEKVVRQRGYLQFNYCTPHIVINGSGGDSDETGYLSWYDTDNLYVGALTGGSWTAFTTMPLTFDTDGSTRQYAHRMYVSADGSVVKAKVWSDEEDEPDTWSVSVTATNFLATALTTGWVGLRTNSESTWAFEVYDFAVGTDGDIAWATPMTASTDFSHNTLGATLSGMWDWGLACGTGMSISIVSGGVSGRQLAIDPDYSDSNQEMGILFGYGQGICNAFDRSKWHDHETLALLTLGATISWTQPGPMLSVSYEGTGSDAMLMNIVSGHLDYNLLSGGNWYNRTGVATPAFSKGDRVFIRMRSKDTGTPGTRGKLWAYGTPEPSYWHLSYNDNHGANLNFGIGWYGGTASGSTSYVEYFSMAYGGLEAPIPEALQTATPVTYQSRQWYTSFNEDDMEHGDQLTDHGFEQLWSPYTEVNLFQIQERIIGSANHPQLTAYNHFSNGSSASGYSAVACSEVGFLGAVDKEIYAAQQPIASYEQTGFLINANANYAEGINQDRKAYGIRWSNTVVYVGAYSTNSWTALTSFPGTTASPDGHNNFRLGINAEGTELRAKWWSCEYAEPATWIRIDVTDTFASPLTNGYVGFLTGAYLRGLNVLEYGVGVNMAAPRPKKVGYTDFSEFSIGMTLSQAGFYQVTGESSGASGSIVAGGIFGKRLAIDGTSGPAAGEVGLGFKPHFALNPEPWKDNEVLGLFTLGATVSQHQPGLALKMDGSSSSAYYYQLCVNAGLLDYNEITGVGFYSRTNATAGTVSTGDRVWIRFRSDWDSTVSYGKIWPYGQAEPVDWAITFTTLSTQNNPYLGIGWKQDASNVTNYLEYFSFSCGDDPAPFPPSMREPTAPPTSTFDRYGLTGAPQEGGVLGPAILVSPGAGATVSTITATLSWMGFNSDKYVLYFGATSPATLYMQNKIFSEDSYCVTGLSHNKRYFWKVLSFDSTGLQAPTTYETDFSGYTLGIEPTTWTEIWHESLYSVAVTSSGTAVDPHGDKRLYMNQIIANRWGYYVDELGDIRNAEILMKVAIVSSDQYCCGPMFRASGSSVAETGYVCYLDTTNNDTDIRRYRNGTSVQQDSSAASLNAIGSTSYSWVRALFFEDEYKVKTWHNGETEPLSWAVEDTDSAAMLTAGKIGIMGYGSDFYVDYFAVKDLDGVMSPEWDFVWSNNTQPTPPSLTSPANGATVYASPVTLEWSSDAPKFDVLFGPTADTNNYLAANTSATALTTYDYGMFTSGLTYYWKVKGKSDGITNCLWADDFSGYTLGKVLNGRGYTKLYYASGWTCHVSNSGSWREEGTIGGQHVVFDGSSTGDKCLAVDELSNAQKDIELLGRFRGSINYGGHLMLRVGGSYPSNEDYYQTQVYHTAPGELSIEKSVNTSLSTLGSTTLNFDASTEWYWVRLQAIGDQLKAKAWSDDELEPSGWLIEVTDSSLETGYVGLGSYFSNDYYICDYFAAFGQSFAESAEREFLYSPLSLSLQLSFPANASTTTAGYPVTLSWSGTGADWFKVYLGTSSPATLYSDPATVTNEYYETASLAAGTRYWYVKGFSQTSENIATSLTTSWSAYTLNQEPAAWSELWNTTQFTCTATVSDTSTAIGDKRLHIDQSGAYRCAFVNDSDIGTIGDVEVLAKIATILDSSSAGAVGLRISGTTGSENAYGFWIRGSSFEDFELRRYEGGVATTLTSATPDSFTHAIGASTYFWIRASAVGNEIKGKIWEDGDIEPVGWAIAVTDSALSSGQVGFQTYSNGADLYCDYFEVKDMSGVSSSEWNFAPTSGAGGGATPKTIVTIVLT